MIALVSALLLSTPISSVDYDWRNVSIVGGGFISGIITHATAKDVVYCRTDIGGAYRLDPKTRKWIPLQDWLTKSQWNWYGVESVAIDPGNAKRVYLAVGTYVNEWGGNGAILRSEDSGSSWKTSPLPFKNGGNEEGRGIGERLMVDPSDGKVLYFGTRLNGLWRSVNAGANWARVENFPVTEFPPRGSALGSGIGWVLFDNRTKRAGPTQHIYVAPAISGVPLYETFDGGQSWKPIEGSPKMIPYHGAMAPNGTLYVTYSNHPGPNGATDGAVFARKTTGEWSEITPIQPKSEKGFGYAGLTLDYRAPGTIMVSTLDRWGKDTIFRSRDWGKTWVSLMEKSSRDVSLSPFLTFGKEEADFGHWIADIEVDPFNSDRVWYGTGATLYESLDLTKADKDLATRWQVAAGGIEETADIDLVSPPTGASVVSGLGDIGGFAHYDLATSSPSGVWTNPYLSNVDSLDFAERKPEAFVRVGRSYNGNQHGSYSIDGAKTWKPLYTDAPGSKSGGGSAAISNDGAVIYWTPQGAFPHLTTDFGQTWTQCEGLPKGAKLTKDRYVSKVLYAQDDSTGAFFRSDDLGKTFAKVGTMPPGENRRFVSTWNVGGHLWLGSSTGLYWSRDGGKSFRKMPEVESVESVGLGIPTPGTRYLTIYIIGKVSGVEGAFRSTDVGEHWIKINDAKTGFGTMNKIVGDRNKFGRVYVGTNGRGILVADPR